jgi:DNA-binding NarL/FixJ family response regulator/class 3 adenylate cyclase
MRRNVDSARVVGELPSGTVTLLFTDVEGSTELVQELGDDYPRLLSDHRRLLRSAMESVGGYEVDCRGDEFFVAFSDAGDALAGVVAAQRAFALHEWPGAATLRVRMGLHTGQPAFVDDSYIGLDVHRAARICSAGHGGQVLLSEATREALPGGEPPEAGLRDLGEHRLKGLPAPERLFQVVADGLASEFPPLREPELGAVVPPTIEPAPAEPTVQPTTAEGDQTKIRVALADDSVLLREGIARLLRDGGLEVVAQAGTGEDLLRLVAMHKPDVAVVDIRMPPTHTDEGVRAAQEIRKRYPGTGVLVLSQYVEAGYAMELLSESAEGVGYLLKDRVSDIDEFRAAVKRVAAGGSALDPAVVSQLVGRRRRHDPLEELTPREREVLELMAEGRSNQAIAERLVITLRAVEKHVTSIFSKLGLPATSEDHRRVLAVLAFLRS